MSGCFWPQDDTVFTEILRRRNSPPRILLNTVTPQQDTAIGPTCTPAFSFSVEDPDVADRILSRWFAYKPGEKPVVFFEASLSSGTTPVRQQKLVIPPQHFTAASELMQNGEHRLQVVIVDGRFLNSPGKEAIPEDRDPYPLPDGGTVVDQSYIDSYLWIVQTSDTTPACN